MRPPESIDRVRRRRALARASRRVAAPARGARSWPRCWPSRSASRSCRSPGRRRADDGGHDPARRPRPGRAVDGDRRPPHERRPGRSAASFAWRAAPRADQFGDPVDLPTQSDKTYRLYAQPPAFGRELEVSARRRRRRRSPRPRPRSRSTTPTQLVVGSRRRAAGRHHRRPRPAAQPEQRRAADRRPRARTTCPTGSRPGARSTAWSGRTSTPRGSATEQLDGAARLGRRRRPAGHRRRHRRAVEPVGLPRRPPALPPDGHDRRRPGLARRPARRASRTAPADLPALSGELADGPALATIGDRVVAAERAVRRRARVTIIGFDPTATWIADTNVGRRPLAAPPAAARHERRPVIGDDSQIVSAVIAAAVAWRCRRSAASSRLLGAYILLIGPINYLVLKRLDRREWAWVTMPVLIVVFAVGAYGFGSLLRGQRASSSTRSPSCAARRARPRAPPRPTSGSSRRSRGTYQVRVPGGALLSSPISGDFFGGDGTTRGARRPAGRSRARPRPGRRLRVAAHRSGPRPRWTSRSSRPTSGSRTAASRARSPTPRTRRCSSAGGRARRHRREPRRPGARRRRPTVDVALQTGPVRPAAVGQDRRAGVLRRPAPARRRHGSPVRPAHHHRPADLRPELRASPGSCRPTAPVVLAWADHELLPVEIEGQTPRRTGNVLYFLPTDLAVSGTTTFRSDLLRSTVVASDAGVLQQGPVQRSTSGAAARELAYRPIAFDGRLTATELAIGMNTATRASSATRNPVEPLARDPGRRAASRRSRRCAAAPFDGLPEVELFDLTTRDLEAAAAPRRRDALRGQGPGPLRRSRRPGRSWSGSSTIATTASGFSLDLAISGDVE